MLSRYEEAVIKNRDNHDRFPAWASVAYKEKFLNRPIVNEYLEILYECMYSIWPNLIRKNRNFRKFITCDLDKPYDLEGYNLKQVILRLGYRLIRQKNLKLAVQDTLNYFFKKFGLDYFDEYKSNIDWIMKVNEAKGNKVAFNFIPYQTDKNKDHSYAIFSKKNLNLLKHIFKSGHEIGFHPGYNTYRSKENFETSANVLREACKIENINTIISGGRQHYLRYDILKTPQLWEENGFVYDSTLTFADQAGFRCGTCYEFSMFDLVNKKKMKLKQRPLINMEYTIISKKYENLGNTEKSLERFKYFENICRKFNGDYVLLWHNHFFLSQKSKDHYLKII